MDINDNNNGYKEKVLKAYGELSGSLHLVEVQRGEGAMPTLGLSLAGNRDLATMSVYVVGIQPASLAASTGLIHIGDELLEINGQILYGRSHLNSSAIIRSVTSRTIRLLLLRSEDYQSRMAVSPLKLPRVEYKDDTHTLIPKKPTSRSSEDCRTGDDSDNRLDVTEGDADDSHTEMEVIDRPSPPLPPPSSLPPVSAAETKLTNIHTSPQIVISIPSGDTALHCAPPVTDRTSAAARHPPSIDRLQQHAAEVTVHRPNDASDSRHTSRSVKDDWLSDSTLVGSSSTPIAAQSVQRITSSHAATELPKCPETDLSKHSPGDDGRRRLADNGAIASAATEAGPSRVLPNSIPGDSSSSADLITTHPHLVWMGGGVHEDPLTCAVATGRPTLVEIRKGKTALGVKVLGGSDTCIKSIIIHEVYSGGAVANDGRLRPGDQINEVNGVDLRECTHNRTLQVLRQTTAPTMRLLVVRGGVSGGGGETGHRDEELCETTSVELMKRPGKGLGISIVERGDCAGIIIADIVKGGAAETDGRLCAGDQILTVNGEDLRDVTQQYAAELLKTLMGKISLSIGRLKAGLRPPGSLSVSRSNSCYSDLGLLKSELNGSDCRSSAAAQQRVTKRPVIGYRNFGMCLKTMSDHDDP